MDLKVIFKLLTYFILCFLIVLMIEHTSLNWGKEFIKQCCSCDIKAMNIEDTKKIDNEIGENK